MIKHNNNNIYHYHHDHCHSCCYYCCCYNYSYSHCQGFCTNINCHLCAYSLNTLVERPKSSKYLARPFVASLPLRLSAFRTFNLKFTSQRREHKTAFHFGSDYKTLRERTRETRPTKAAREDPDFIMPLMPR